LSGRPAFDKGAIVLLLRFMSVILSILWPVALSFIGWLVFQLIGRPVRDFLDLRREVRRRMLQFANVPVVKLTPAGKGLDPSELVPRGKEAQDLFRDLGSQMRSFGETEYGATWVLRRFFIWTPFKPG
jgi:hypothetical protein